MISLVAPEMTTSAPAEGELTIDELAAASGVPSRTVRFYQSRGALMPPVIHGRVAYYGPKHRERLELIARLQDRGLSIDAIRDLCASIDKGGVDLAEWLGVEEQLGASWANDQPRTVTEAELYELAGTKRLGLLADLVRKRIVERKGDVYLVHSPALFALAMKLERAGIDLGTSVAGAELLRKHLERAARGLVDVFVDAAHAGAIDPSDLPKLLQALHPTGQEAVRVIFGREMEKALRELMKSGKAASLPARARRARKQK